MQPYQKQVMQGMQNKSWKPFEPCKTCLKGDLGGPGKTKQAQVGQTCLSGPKCVQMGLSGHGVPKIGQGVPKQAQTSRKVPK